jgi:hypothetical protein
MSTAHRLSTVRLGDLLDVDGCGPVTVRSVAALSAARPSFTGFVVCGELDVVVTVPHAAGIRPSVHRPRPVRPDEFCGAVSVAAGVSSFWAPHSPPEPTALGELAWRVVSVPGYPEDVFIVWRGQEAIAFTFSHRPHRVGIHALPPHRTVAGHTRRQQAYVVPVGAIAELPAGARRALEP